MSLINRIKKARAKADKLGAKSKKAEFKGKEEKAARLEKRSEKKSGKADNLEFKTSGPKDTSRKTSYKLKPRNK